METISAPANVLRGLSKVCDKNSSWSEYIFVHNGYLWASNGLTLVRRPTGYKVSGAAKLCDVTDTLANNKGERKQVLDIQVDADPDLDSSRFATRVDTVAEFFGQGQDVSTHDIDTLIKALTALKAMNATDVTVQTNKDGNMMRLVGDVGCDAFVVGKKVIK